MKISAIKRNCAARCCAGILYEVHSRTQWITNGSTAFRVDGFELDLDGLAELLDLSEKKRCAWNMFEKPTADERFQPEPVIGEEDTDACGAQVWADAVYIALPTSRGMLWIPYEPVRHIKEDNRRYGVRWRGDRPLVAVYGDLTCSVLTMPLDNDNADQLRRFASQMAAPAFQWSDPAARADAEAEALAARMMDGEEGEGLK